MVLAGVEDDVGADPELPPVLVGEPVADGQDSIAPGQVMPAEVPNVRLLDESPGEDVLELARPVLGRVEHDLGPPLHGERERERVEVVGHDHVELARGDLVPERLEHGRRVTGERPVIPGKMSEGDPDLGHSPVRERDMDVLDTLEAGIGEAHAGDGMVLPEEEQLTIHPGVVSEIAQRDDQYSHGRGRVRTGRRNSTILNWVWEPNYKERCGPRRPVPGYLRQAGLERIASLPGFRSCSGPSPGGHWFLWPATPSTTMQGPRVR